MKNLEFKIYPTVVQAQTIDLWLEQLKWIWNRGLELRLEAQQRRWRDKSDCTFPDSLKIKWKNSKLVGIGIRKTPSGHKYCEIRTHRHIENPQKFSQSAFFSNAHLPQWLHNLPSKFRAAVNHELNKAWKAYSDPKHPARKPKFKDKSDKIRSLLNRNAGGKSKELKPEIIPGSDNGYVQFPKLGKLYVKGLFKRFSLGCEYGVARILKEPSGYYLQVTVKYPEHKLLNNDKAVGIDPGLMSVLTTDNSRGVKPPKLYRQQQKKIKRLHRKLSRQQKNSNSRKKTKKIIARLNEKIRRSRNAFNHKLSTKIVREYGGIVVEDIQIKNLIRRPKPKKRDGGKGYAHTGAKRKSGLNKSFADSALGDLLSKIETKATSADREFIRVSAHYTSLGCSQCGAQIQKSLSTRTHRCTECGFTDSRDGNAGKNILLKGRESFKRIYRTWEWETTMETLRKVKRDETVNSPSSGTTSNSETLSHWGLPPEAVEAAPKSEHDFQLPSRGSPDVKTKAWTAQS